MNEESTPYYRHSGTVGVTGAVMMILCGGGAAIVLGGLYGLLIHYVPFVYLNCLATLFLGIFVGKAVGLGARLGKARSGPYVSWVALLVGVFALYCSWVAWIWALSDQALFVLRPAPLFEIVGAILDTGAWDMFGFTPTGFALGLVWVLEAVIIVGGATIVAGLSAMSTPFCESCDHWADQEKRIGPLASVPHNQRDALQERLELGDFTMLEELPLVSRDKRSFTELKLVACSSCQELCTLSVTAVIHSVNSKGDPDRGEEEIVDQLLIHPETRDHLARHWVHLPTGDGPENPNAEAPEVPEV